MISAWLIGKLVGATVAAVIALCLILADKDARRGLGYIIKDAARQIIFGNQ